MAYGNGPVNRVDPSGLDYGANLHLPHRSAADLVAGMFEEDPRVVEKRGIISGAIAARDLSKGDHARLLKTAENLATLNREWSVVAIKPKYASETEWWTQDAKTEWPSAFVYNVTSLTDLAARLVGERYPNGSIRLLIMGSHNSDMPGFNNSATVAADAQAARTIAEKLTDDAIVDIQACNSRSGIGNAQFVANSFQSIVITTPSGYESWNDAPDWEVTRPTLRVESIRQARRQR